MPARIERSEEQIATVIGMRKEGATWAAIAKKLGLSRNVVIEIGRDVNAKAPTKAIVADKTPPHTSGRIGREALPTGHPLTMQALTELTPSIKNQLTDHFNANWAWRNQQSRPERRDNAAVPSNIKSGLQPAA